MPRENPSSTERQLRQCREQLGFYFQLANSISFSSKDIINCTKKEKIDEQKKRIETFEKIIIFYSNSSFFRVMLPEFDDQFNNLILDINSCLPSNFQKNKIVSYDRYNLSLNLVAYVITAFRYNIHLEYVKHLENTYKKSIKNNYEACLSKLKDGESLSSNGLIDIAKDLEKLTQIFELIKDLKSKIVEEIGLVSRYNNEINASKEKVENALGRMKKGDSRYIKIFPKALIAFREKIFTNYVVHITKIDTLFCQLSDECINFDSTFNEIFKKSHGLEKIS
ncbi:hypothetical protein HON22_02785 [Candidatus Peregrinibacteria bacterium]|jgi:hypothetical protein|nr:hypothetical protein [Candidatus Peregrinibacteria bacterium]